MIDWGGKVAAWLGAVAAASGALAALLAQMSQGPLRGRKYDLFLGLVVIAAVAFAALLLTGLLALWAAWRSQDRNSQVVGSHRT